MKKTILAGLAVLWPVAALSADEIKPFDAKPGLWETTNTTEMTGMPAMPAMPQISEENLAKMPPEQRARIEAMMKGRAGAPRSTTTKSCLTRESLNRAMAFASDNQACARKVISSSGSKQEIHVDCAMGQTKTSGDMTIERLDAEHVKGTMVMKSVDSDRPMNMKMSFQSKWVSADCGDVKPAGEK